MTEAEFSYVLDVKGNVVKREKDLRQETESKINEMNVLISQEKFEEALELLLSQEKITRNAADLFSYLKVTEALLELHAKYDLWEQFNDLIISLSKKRGQFKQAVIEIVQRAVVYIDGVDDANMRIKISKTLCQISENKIYVENERARLLTKLALDEESVGNITDAFELVKDLHVESYTLMPIHEKNEIMIDQVRLCIIKKDIIRAQIIANRINPVTISDSEFPAIKFKYYQVMIDLKYIEGNFIEICRLGLSALNLSFASSSPEIFYPLFTLTILCLLISPFDEKRRDLGIRVTNHRNINEMIILKSIVGLFNKEEIISWGLLKNEYEKYMIESFSPKVFTFCKSEEECFSLYKTLQSRVLEHNLMVVYNCYSQISLARLSELLCSSEDEVETAVCKAVSSKVIYARINRPKRIVTLKKTLSSTEILNSYSSKISNLLLDVGHTATLINKEYNQSELCST